MHYSKLFSVQLLRMRRLSESLRREVHGESRGIGLKTAALSMTLTRLWVRIGVSWVGLSSHGDFFLILPK